MAKRDLLKTLREMGCDVSVTLSWTRTCPKCGAEWTGEASGKSIEEAVREATSIEQAVDADPGNEARCREAQEERVRG